MTHAPGETLVYDPFQALQQYVKRWDKDPEFLFSSLRAYEQKLKSETDEAA